MSPEEDGSNRTARENPYRSPESGPLGKVKSLRRRGNSGCLFLFLFALPVLNTFGFLMALAGPYAPAVLVMGLGGFAGGAALGAYVSAKVMHQPWWSSCRWATYGLVGMLVPICLILALLSRFTF